MLLKQHNITNFTEALAPEHLREYLVSGNSEVTGEAWKELGRKCLELLSSLFRAPAALDRDGKRQAGVDGEQLQVEDTHGLPG